jgi:hypothetical protein
VCYDESPLEGFPATTHLAEHYVCRACCSSYIRIKVMDEQVCSVRCPVQGCKKLLGYDEVREYGDQDSYKRCQ